MASGIRGTTLLSSDCPQESVRLLLILLGLVVYMNLNLGQDSVKQWEDLGMMWIMITIMTTIYWPGKEIDWGWGTLGFLTAPFRGDLALQTSITQPALPIFV